MGIPQEKKKIPIGWRAWYKDGGSYSSKKFNWQEIPVYNLVLVCEYYFNNSKLIHSGFDYVLKREDESIISFETVHLERHLINGIPEGSIKFGVWIDNQTFEELQEKVQNSSWVDD